MSQKNIFYIKPMPEQCVELALDGVIARPEFIRMLAGYRPKSGDDRWLIYYRDGWFNFHRTRSGSCIFQLKTEPNGDHHLAPIVRVNRDSTQYHSYGDDYDVTLLAYLIDRYLLGRNPPFPQPPRLQRQYHRIHQQHVTGAEQAPAATVSLINLIEEGLGDS